MILVTGASGFLGRHLVRQLSERKLSVRALYHSRTPAADMASLPGVEWLCCDLLDVFDVEEAMEGVEDVYHCAAIVSFDAVRREEMLHFNPESTANIVNQALLQNIRKLVYVSSVAALGRNGIENKEITEEEEWGESGYNSAYGLSKYLAETEVWRAIGEGLNAVIVNPGIILGACSSEDPPARLLELAWSEFPFYTRGLTSWVSVGDVVKVLTFLMESEITAERFICGANYTYREIISRLAGAMGRKPPHILAGAFMTGMAWRWSAVKRLFGAKPGLTRETASNANLLSVYNNNKLLTALPNFAYMPISQAIEQMASGFVNPR
jgi:dihydroflavonol-4-reductase